MHDGLKLHVSHSCVRTLRAAGLAAFAAQAKYDSFILEAITLASAATLATRVVLGYQRMAQRCVGSCCVPSQRPFPLPRLCRAVKRGELRTLNCCTSIANHGLHSSQHTWSPPSLLCYERQAARSQMHVTRVAEGHSLQCAL
jgi:hypothetical protein